jgi:hypothetical protein
LLELGHKCSWLVLIKVPTLADLPPRRREEEEDEEESV